MREAKKQMLQAQLIMWAIVITSSLLVIATGALGFYFAVKWVVRH